MCNSAPKPPDPPKFKDPRLKDKEYKAVAKDLGIKKLETPRQLYRVEKVMARQDENEYKQTLADMETRNQTQREAEIARQQAQFEQMTAIQQAQFDQNMQFQQKALDRQLAAQADLQQRSEESALRSQVPQFTSNSSNARRVKSKRTSRGVAQQMARGTSQLRIPLSISSGSSSPVKLNIGS